MKNERLKGIIFFIFPYLLLSSQYIVNEMRSNFESSGIIYFIVAIGVGILVQLMKHIDVKMKLIIEGVNILFLSLCGLNMTVLSISLPIILNPFTHYLAYGFASVIAMVYIGIVVVDFIIEIYKQYRNRSI